MSGCYFIGGLGGVSEQVDPCYRAIIAIIVEERLNFMLKVFVLFPSPCNVLQEMTGAKKKRKNSKIRGQHLLALERGLSDNQELRQVNNEITALTQRICQGGFRKLDNSFSKLLSQYDL